jgi:hypothetical protein
MPLAQLPMRQTNLTHRQLRYGDTEYGLPCAYIFVVSLATTFLLLAFNMIKKEIDESYENGQHRRDIG